LIFLYASLVGNATAQVKFIQLTDPHLFDKAEDVPRNREILIDAVAKINELNKENNQYAFVVVTGDIGIEQIVKTASAAERKNRIDEGAKMMANILASSEVRVWLFVPGNNDLVDELDNTIESYHQFIGELHNALRLYQIDVIDLCPANSAKPYKVEKHDEYAFLGFNNASFKNNNDATRVSDPSDKCCATRVCSPAGKIRCIQRAEIQRVSDLVGKETSKFTYIFYHIPEVDDPFLEKKREEVEPPNFRKLHEFHQSRKMRADVTGPEFVNSSWFVDKVLRNEWSQVTGLSKVMGLFAGHLHVNKPTRYGQQTKTNLKLFVCPPLAIKQQPIEKEQARGFQEVSIDEGLDPTLLNGEVKTKIYWYNGKEYSFSLDTPPTPTPSPTPTPKGSPTTSQTVAQISTVLRFVVVVVVIVVAVFVVLIWSQLNKQGERPVANTRAIRGMKKRSRRSYTTRRKKKKNAKDDGS